jgi:hypothetical protein
VYEISSEKKGARTLELTEIKPLWETRGGRKILVAEHKWDLHKRLCDQGVPYDEAAKLAEIVPQGRWMLPLDPKILFVARKASRANEHFALVERHFPAVDFVPSEDLPQHLRQVTRAVANHLASLFKKRTGDWCNFCVDELKPTNWTTERAQVALARIGLSDVLTKKQTIRKFFIKPNETLGKMKPRGIQACADEVAMLQAITVKIVAELLFDRELMLDHSIKHISARELPERMSRFLARFKRGWTLSVDFGNWDSTLLKHIRENVENLLLDEFYRSVGCDNNHVTKALGDRAKTRIEGRSTFFKISATDFGRESGDGGTSVLNYATNFVLSLALEQHLAGMDQTDPEQCLQHRVKRKSWMDSIHEGDDTVYAFGSRFVERIGGPSAVVEKVTKFYGALGMKLEPACSEGVSFDPSKVLVPVGGRVEFVSKLFLDAHPPLAVSMVPRTVRSAAVTFSAGPLNDVMFSAALSGLYNHCNSPLLREVYGLLRRLSECGSTPTYIHSSGYRGRTMTELKCSTPVDVVNRMIDGCRCTDANVRGLYAREYPRLTVERQFEFEARLQSLERPTEEMWPEIRRLFADLLACC